MKKVVQQTLTQGNDYVEYMLHSSEYMAAAQHLKINRISSSYMSTWKHFLTGWRRR
jgi:hypothetical protein